MKTIVSKVAMAISALALSASASAVSLFGSDIYIDTGKTILGDDPNCGTCLNDGDSKTGIFKEFGFSAFLATSVYDFSDGDILGSFFDTNDPAVLTALGIPAIGGVSGVPVGGGNPLGTQITLVHPGPGEVDIDALSPLVPPIANTDNEGFINSWAMSARYTLNGTLLATGPVYNSGSLDLYFDDYLAATSVKVLTLTLTGSNLTLANLDLLFNVTSAQAGYLWVKNPATGLFVDVSTLVGTATPAQASLDTNVNPPFPDPNQLLLLVDSKQNPNLIRQATLDGSIGYRVVPVPGTLGLLGLGLLGLGSLRKRKSV